VRTNLDVARPVWAYRGVQAYGQLGSPWQWLKGAGVRPTLSAAGQHVDFNAIDGTRVQTAAATRRCRRRSGGSTPWSNPAATIFTAMPFVRVRAGHSRATTSENAPQECGHRGELHTYRTSPAPWAGRIIPNKSGFSAARYLERPNARSWTRSIRGTRSLNVRGAGILWKRSYQRWSDGNRPHGFLPLDQRSRNAECEPVRPRESMEDQETSGLDTKVEWQTVRGNALVASVQYGRWNFRATLGASLRAKVSTLDIGTQFDRRQFHHQWTGPGRQRHHTRGSSAGTSRICSSITFQVWVDTSRAPLMMAIGPWKRTTSSVPAPVQ